MTSTTAVVVAAAHLAVGKKAAIAGSLSVPGQATPTGENLTTGAYTDWRYWSTFTNQSADYIRTAGGSSISIATANGASRNNSGSPLSGTFTSTADATNLGNSSTGNSLNDLNTSSYAITGTSSTVAIILPASATLRNGKVVFAFQSGSGGGQTANVNFHLSDGSAADVNKTITTVNFGIVDQEFTFSWNSATAGQTLTMTINMTTGGFSGTNLFAQVAMWK